MAKTKKKPENDQGNLFGEIDELHAIVQAQAGAVDDLIEAADKRVESAEEKLEELHKQRANLERARKIILKRRHELEQRNEA